MNLTELNKVANAMVAPGRGILAADESSSTIKKRFDAIGVESTPITGSDAHCTGISTANGDYIVDHSEAIFVIDPNGNLAAVLTGPFTVDALQSDFRRILTARA